MMDGRKPIYVETTIRADMEALWAHTQRPELHRQWDLRFSDIAYLPRTSSEAPQGFTYSTRIGFGLRIAGTGETRSRIASKRNARLSTLVFGSRQPWSLIRTGAGYWKYTEAGERGSRETPGQPEQPGKSEQAEQAEKPEQPGRSGPPEQSGGAGREIRFATQYDYRTRFGWTGAAFDRWLFRPLFGWATAWSFDALRIWLEDGIPPRMLVRQTLIHYGCAAALALLWIGQGLLPKLLFPGHGELALMQEVGWIPDRWAPLLVKLLGAAEAGIGIASLPLHRSRPVLLLQMLLLAAMALAAAAASPGLLATPYNPAALALGMIALCFAVLHTRLDLPQARRCRRTPNRSYGGR